MSSRVPEQRAIIQEWADYIDEPRGYKINWGAG